MTLKDRISNDYFEWIYNLVCGERFSEKLSYKKLLMHLHNTDFIYLIPKDGNRSQDGIDLRYRFAYEYTDIKDADSYLKGPCSVLEMMVALAVRCEETIMDDPTKGDRTGQWFWNMIVSLGFGGMSDDRYDRFFVDKTLDRFLSRKYEPNGKGGLFTIRNPKRDMRKIEIWYQLCDYLNSIV